jgi:hypothetical protein
MALPNYMTDEQMLASGFEVSTDNPELARHKLYPKLSFRHRCQSCDSGSKRYKDRYANDAESENAQHRHAPNTKDLFEIVYSGILTRPGK